MKPIQRFSTDHGDVIHDICYDWYGKRLATCSSDQTIKVFDIDGDGQWHCVTDFKAHQSAVWKVKWAHPEFGQILASASFDRTVKIWEEIPGRVKNWTKKATFYATRSVQDIKFAPRHLGLKLAMCSKDGKVRVLEANDITNLTAWTVKTEDEFLTGKEELNCLDWNSSPFDPPTIVTGGSDSIAKVWEYNEGSRKWVHVGSLGGHAGDIHDVSWAPNLGQPAHKIATAGKDGVRIWEIKPTTGGPLKYKATEVAKFEDHHAEVWRVEWNITGTVLASSGDDGMVRFWKANLAGEWRRLMDAKPEPSSQVTSNLQPPASLQYKGNTTTTTTNSTTTTTTTTTSSGQPQISAYWPGSNASVPANQYFTPLQQSQNTQYQHNRKSALSSSFPVSPLAPPPEPVLTTAASKLSSQSLSSSPSARKH